MVTHKMFILDLVGLALGVFLSVAFFTLFERKILGYAHFRKGPTKLYFFGILQPISDAVKLFSKEGEIFFGGFLYFFFVGPLVGIVTILILWGLVGGVEEC